MAQIRLDEVGKVYPGGVTAVDRLSLDIADGEFMVLVGPSGCGKSTALRMIAGLEDVSGGTISIGGTPMNEVAAKDRDIAMVFQNYALYPHMTVAQNLAFALQTRRVPKAEITRRVGQVARLLGLDELMSRKPAALSGGQRQRVAMGRAIVREPQAYLMDEPLSNLDAKLRVSMRASLAQLHERLGVTTVYVTHDQTEAMTLGDRVCVLRDGVLQQVDTPQNLFSRPANLFVASFIGSPAMNLAAARLESDGSGAAVTFAGHRLPVPAGILETRPALARYAGGEVILGARPSDFEDASLADPDWARMPVTARLTEQLGSEIHVMFSLPADPVRHPDLAALAATGGEGEETGVALDPGGTPWIARVSARSKITSGTPAELAVDTTALYFFDPETGASITH